MSLNASFYIFLTSILVCVVNCANADVELGQVKAIRDLAEFAPEDYVATDSAYWLCLKVEPHAQSGGGVLPPHSYIDAETGKILKSGGDEASFGNFYKGTVQVILGLDGLVPDCVESGYSWEEPYQTMARSLSEAINQYADPFVVGGYVITLYAPSAVGREQFSLTIGIPESWIYDLKEAACYLNGVNFRSSVQAVRSASPIHLVELALGGNEFLSIQAFEMLVGMEGLEYSVLDAIYMKSSGLLQSVYTYQLLLGLGYKKHDRVLGTLVCLVEDAKSADDFYYMFQGLHAFLLNSNLMREERYSLVLDAVFTWIENNQSGDDVKREWNSVLNYLQQERKP